MSDQKYISIFFPLKLRNVGRKKITVSICSVTLKIEQKYKSNVNVNILILKN